MRTRKTCAFALRAGAARRARRGSRRHEGKAEPPPTALLAIAHRCRGHVGRVRGTRDRGDHAGRCGCLPAVRVLLSIILGLSVTRLVRGLAGFIQPDVRHRVSLIHLGWVAWALLNVVSFWWWEFRLSTIERWSFALYVFIVVYASMYYFLSVLLFPDDLERYSGYEDFFLSRRVWFFGFVFLTEALDVGDTWIKGVEHLRSLGPEYFVRIGVLLAVCAVGAATRNPQPTRPGRPGRGRAVVRGQLPHAKLLIPHLVSRSRSSQNLAATLCELRNGKGPYPGRSGPGGEAVSRAGSESCKSDKACHAYHLIEGRSQ